MENIINQLDSRWQYSYYRSSSQTEVDLVLEGTKEKILAIEIKRSGAPKLSKGFHVACDNISATEKFVVYSGIDRYPIANDTEVIDLIAFLKMIHEIYENRAE